MLKENFFIKIIRKKESFLCKFKEDEDSFFNNVKNNAIDTILLLKDDKEVFSYKKMQTVANYPNAKTADTLAPGTFQIQCFVNKRNYKENIHGIIDTVDMEGQVIDKFSMQNDAGNIKGRWLIHGNLDGRTLTDYKHAYSMGCLMFCETKKLEEFNTLLKENGILPGDVINAELVEE